MAEPLNLPDILEPYRAQIEASRKPCIRISATPDDHSGFLDSKFGGYPYLPIGAEYPKDSRGQPLTLLAQLNFAEIPPLEPYPTKGILQFYIPFGEENGRLYGWNYERPDDQRDWRILWFPEPDESIAQTDFSLLPDDQTMQYWTPLAFANNRPERTNGLALRMGFERFDQPVTSTDYQFNWLLHGENRNEDFFDSMGEKGDEAWKNYFELSEEFEHQIGGFASFSNHDPRTRNSKNKSIESDEANPLLLLLQITGDDYIRWGDLGIANFFITRGDLIRREFSRVRYYWDCG